MAFIGFIVLIVIFGACIVAALLTRSKYGKTALEPAKSPKDEQPPVGLVHVGQSPKSKEDIARLIRKDLEMLSLSDQRGNGT